MEKEIRITLARVELTTGGAPRGCRQLRSEYRSRALQRPKAGHPPPESSCPAPCPAPCWSYLAATFSGGVGQAVRAAGETQDDADTRVLAAIARFVTANS